MSLSIITISLLSYSTAFKNIQECIYNFIFEKAISKILMITISTIKAALELYKIGKLSITTLGMEDFGT